MIHNCEPFSTVLRKEVNSCSEIENTYSCGTITFVIHSPSGGEIYFEGTIDGVQWERLMMRSIERDIYTNRTDNGDSYIGSVIGIRRFRFRTKREGTSDGSVIGQFSSGVSVIEGIEFGHPPHKIGHPLVHKDVAYTSAQTGAVIWKPNSGNKFVLTDIVIIVGGTTDGRITVFDETNSEGNIIFNGLIDVSNNKQFSLDHSFIVPLVSSAVDNSLKITSTTDMTIDVTVHGYEV